MRKLLLALFLITSVAYLFSETVFTNSNTREAVKINVLSSDDYSTTLEMNLNFFEKNAVVIDGQTYYNIQINKEGKILNSGDPELPFVGRSIVINYQAKPVYQILESEYVDYPVSVSPSKGSLLRNVDPATIPYTFSESYKRNAFYPENIFSLGEPYILRELRGVTTGFSPMQYNPQTHTLRVYKKITVKITNDGFDTRNTLSQTPQKISNYFAEIYRNHFINYNTNPVRYTPIEEQGSMLIITYPAFAEAMAPFISWKKQKGIPVTMVTTNESGTTSTAIKTFIQNYYTDHPELTFVHLVGDAAQVPTLTEAGGGSDPKYVMIGGTDYYPELFISRFSAENVEQVNTQVTKAIWYDRDVTDGAWVQKGLGLASAEGGGSQGDMGESDATHMNLIRTDLLTYGYTSVDQIYDPGASSGAVSSALNEGRGFINYVGHGSNNSWVTSGFSNTNVTALTNDFKLPVIVSVACVNGNFTSTTCFAEAWLRAKNNTTGNPTGAATTYMSTINQPWNEPMRGQDVITDLMISNDKYTIGGLFFNGSSAMLDAYNNNTSAKNTMATWTIFGDASLTFRSKTPVAMNVESMENLFMGVPNYEVSTGVADAMVCLFNPETQEIIASGYTNETGIVNLTIEPAIAEPCTLKLTVTAKDKITNVRNILVVPNNGPYVTLGSYSFAQGQTPSIGSTVNMDVTFNNIGNGITTNINAVLRSNSPYVTLIDTVAVVTNIDANSNATIQNAFSFSIADNAPDMTEAVFYIVLNDDQNRNWSITMRVNLFAPVITAGQYQIVDTQGNNDGQIDPGETVVLRLPVTNTGHAVSDNGTVNVIVLNSYLTLGQNIYPFEAVPAQEQQMVEITLSANADTPLGSPAQIGYLINCGAYAYQSNISTFVGLEFDNFETGDFSSYQWTQAGNQPWSVVNENAYEGTYCAQSGNINQSQSSEFSVQRTLASDGNITFWYKVSSESGYDFLQFFVDGVKKNEWSGDVTWTQASYPVVSGNHTFKWKYVKDNMVDGGQDCAWVDMVVFPATGGNAYVGPLYYCEADTLTYENPEVNTSMTQSVRFVNFGTQVLSLVLNAPQGFTFDNGSIVKSITIPHNSYSDEALIFLPTQAVDYSNYLRITTNDIEHISADSIYIVADARPTGSNDPENTPLMTQLKGNYPNPFNPTTSIHFSLKENQEVTLKIYNTKGQLVKKLVSGIMEKGQHKVVWNGKDHNERTVSSGVYFYQLETRETRQTKKMLLMK